MDPLEASLTRHRGRMALAASVEDLQRGLPYGASLALAAGALNAAGLVPFSPLEVVSLGAVGVLVLPVAALLTRRIAPARVASLLDERLDLQQRVSTAWGVQTGSVDPSPLTPLLEADAEAALAAVPAAAVRRAFRPRPQTGALVLGLALAAVAAVASSIEPAAASARTTVAETPREKAEKDQAARAARRVKEQAERIEKDAAAAQEEALREAAAAMRREAERMLRRETTLATAMAAFTRMGETVRAEEEKLAGTTMQALEEMKQSGRLSAADRELGRLLDALSAAGLPEMAGELSDLENALIGKGGEGDWNRDRLQALLDAVKDLEKALRDGASAMEGRDGLREGLGMFGDPDLMKEIGERLAQLMETLRKQGWEPCKSEFPDGLRAGMPQPPDPYTPPTREQLQAMIEKLKEMQRLAELGRLAFCQNCGLKPGGT